MLDFCEEVVIKNLYVDFKQDYSVSAEAFLKERVGNIPTEFSIRTGGTVISVPELSNALHHCCSAIHTGDLSLCISEAYDFQAHNCQYQWSHVNGDSQVVIWSCV